MAWTTPKTWASGYVVLASDLNTHLRDNLNVTAPAVMTGQGDIIYGSSANTPARLAKDANATRSLTNTGTSNNPAWAQVALATGVSGTLPVGNGGTGATTLTANGALIGNGTSAIAAVDMSTKGGLLVGDGTGNPSVLAVGGTANYVLKVDSGETTGMKWAAGGGEDISVRVYDGSYQSIANASATAVAYDTETYDTDTMHDTSTNNDRLIAKTAGKFLVTAHMGFAADGTGVRELHINHSADGDIAVISRNAEANRTNYLSIATVYDMDVDEYVICQVYQNSGGSLNLYNAIWHSFQMTKILG